MSYNIDKLISTIRKLSNKIDKKVKIMNVCGSHEHTVAFSGMRSLLPENIEIIPGPGCPVCVCSESDVMGAIKISTAENTILATYGDMLRVPTRIGSIRSNGGNYKMISAPHEALKLAEANPEKIIVFFSVGFETTTAPTAALIEQGMPKNLKILSSHKLTPEIMEVLVKDTEVGVDAFIAPGHVSAIVGSNAWKVFPEKYNIPTIVAGFNPEDLLIAIARVLIQIIDGIAKLENVYGHVVKPEGNTKAIKLMYKYFEKSNVNWRGIGVIPLSGLELKDEFSEINARKVFSLPEIEEKKITDCICDKIVLGKAYPVECKLFGKSCTPQNPVGPCMVSLEGACNIWFRSKQS